MNSEQAKALSNFFLDVAKGLALATLGATAFPDGNIPFILRIFTAIISGFLTYVCVKIGLNLLENKNAI